MESYALIFFLNKEHYPKKREIIFEFTPAGSPPIFDFMVWFSQDLDTGKFEYYRTDHFEEQASWHEWLDSPKNKIVYDILEVTKQRINDFELSSTASNKERKAWSELKNLAVDFYSRFEPKDIGKMAAEGK